MICSSIVNTSGEVSGSSKPVQGGQSDECYLHEKLGDGKAEWAVLLRLTSGAGVTFALDKQIQDGCEQEDNPSPVL